MTKICGGEVKIKTNIIYNEDCLDGMRKLPSKSVDLVITSPPYNLGNDFHSNSIRYESYAGDDMKEFEYQEWQKEVLSECYRVLKDNGSLWYNHKVRIKDGKAIHPMEFLLDTDFILKQEITWNQKKGANVAKIRCFPFSERIYWMTKSEDVKIFNKNNYKDVWNIVPKHSRKDFNHPAVMAEEVVDRIYSLYDGEKGLTVLDPFAGVGTTFLGMPDNYNYIGFEVNKEYIKTAKKRINKLK